MFDLPDQFTAHFLARLEELRIRTRRQYAGMGKGAHLSPKRGSSLEFNDYRHYAPGDDFRHIDWGLYGRTDKYYIKLFKEEEDLLTYIFLDASASMTYPAGDRKFEYAVATALALAYVALGSGDRVMIRVLGGSGGLAPAFVHGRHRIVELARKLREVSPGGQYDFAQVLAREMLSIRRAGKVFVISDFLMMLNTVTKGLGLFLAASMDLTAVQILGGRELKGHGLEGDVEVIDSESGERVRVAIGVREREQYQETMLRLTREIRSFCLKRGLHYALYVTDREFQSFFLRAVAELGLAH
ncbi:MAG: DUF58 domain-containing protein [Deltaproteobacteria bacterium]|jgi:uncharacterized protein (DUF58 family)|nr:DUF58 domain-containing protein [Deltaproteobacteria bacterium]